MTDFHYINNGIWIRLIPNTPRAENVWRELNSAGDDVIFFSHWNAFKKQIKDAGYTVRKAPKPKMTDDELLMQLSA